MAIAAQWAIPDMTRLASSDSQSGKLQCWHSWYSDLTMAACATVACCQYSWACGLRTLFCERCLQVTIVTYNVRMYVSRNVSS